MLEGGEEAQGNDQNSFTARTTHVAARLKVGSSLLWPCAQSKSCRELQEARQEACTAGNKPRRRVMCHLRVKHLLRA